MSACNTPKSVVAVAEATWHPQQTHAYATRKGHRSTFADSHPACLLACQRPAPRCVATLGTAWRTPHGCELQADGLERTDNSCMR